MINANDIHQSIIDADDLEEIRAREMSISDVLGSLARHPFQVISRWNWKSALLGALLRASFYFGVYKASRESWLVTLTAVGVEFIFRFLTSGISGALVQSFRKAQPAWLATLIISITLPAFGHTVEFFAHYFQETYFRDVFAASQNSARQQAFAISVLVSVLSAIFNMFMMRHGVMLVGAGDETKSLWGDVKRIPYLVSEFTLYLPKQIIKLIGEFKFLYAIGIFLFYGFSVGAILGFARWKFSWAYASTLGSWAILLGAIIVVYTGRIFFRVFDRK